MFGRAGRWAGALRAAGLCACAREIAFSGQTAKGRLWVVAPASLCVEIAANALGTERTRRVRIEQEASHTTLQEALNVA